jgi:hypothetical protein
MTPPDADFHGDVKTFVTAAFTHPLLVTTPDQADDLLAYGTGAADLRLKLGLSGERWRLDLHDDNIVQSVVSDALAVGAGSQLGAGLTAPQLVDLTYEPDVGDQLVLRTGSTGWRCRSRPRTLASRSAASRSRSGPGWCSPRWTWSTRSSRRRSTPSTSRASTRCGSTGTPAPRPE